MVGNNKSKRYGYINFAGRLSAVMLLLVSVSGCQVEPEAEHIPAETIAVTAEPTAIPVVETEEPVNEVTIIMAGDNLLHDRLYESGLNEDGSYNYDHLYANIRNTIDGYDIAIINQEVILGGTELGLSGYPRFNSPFEVADALDKAGFDVVCHSTNHAMDQGYQGILNCLDNWRTNHPQIDVTGINLSQEEQDSILIEEVNGIRIAILNYTYGLNGLRLPGGKPYLVNLLDEQEVAEDVAEAEELADFTIVCPHWGTEYTHTESAYQRNWAELMISKGADLIIGTHPHVIQPVRWDTSENGNTALVYYSLGNFINATNQYGKVADRMLGELATITVTEDQGVAFISDYGAIPVVSHVDSDPKEDSVYLLSDYTEELAEANLIKKQDSRFSLEYLQELWSRMVVE